MKQIFITLTAIILVFTTLTTIAQIKTTIPNEVHLLQNPFIPMNILLMPSNVDGIIAQQGDLVMAFAGNICTGAAIVQDVNQVLNLVATSTDEVSKGYKSGQVIRLEYHSIYANTVYELTPLKIILGSMNYEELGTLYAEFKANALSVEDKNYTPKIEIYPNPVNQQLNIVFNFDNAAPDEYVNLELLNNIGQIMFSGKYNLNQLFANVDVAGLSTGVYTLVLTNENFKFTKKVIKK